MTSIESVYSAIQERLQDPAGVTYTEAKLRTYVKMALRDLLNEFRRQSLTLATRSQFGVLPAGATSIDPRFHNLPPGTYSNLHVRPLARKLSLKSALPTFSEGIGMVLEPFEKPVTPPSTPTWQIFGERRVPELNGEWAVQVAEDGQTITVPGLLALSTVDENDESLAGWISEGTGNWMPVAVNGGVGWYAAKYEHGRYLFQAPFSQAMQFRMDLATINPDDYLTSSAQLPYDDIEQFLVADAMAHLLKDRDGNPGPYQQEAADFLNPVIDAAILKDQRETAPFDPGRRSHAQVINEELPW